MNSEPSWDLYVKGGDTVFNARGGGGGLACLPVNCFVYISVCTPHGG